MDTYNENESNRKQAMIPLIALFICFLAIAGVGVAYAFNSDILIKDNPVNEQYFTLDYTNQSGTGTDTVIAIPVDTKDMTITTSVTVADTDGNPETKERTFNATINKVDNPENNTAQFTREFYVKLASNMDADQKFAIEGDVITTDSVINAIFGNSTFKFYKGIGFTEEVNAGQFTASQDGVKYKVVLTVPIKANVNVKSLDLANGGEDNIVDATTLATALRDLAKHTFSVKLTATPVES